MTTNQRDILAAVITQSLLKDSLYVSYEQWIEEYELHRKRIAQFCEELGKAEEEKKKNESTSGN